MSRPVIGVTGPERGGAAAWWFTRWAIHRSGGVARRITSARPSKKGELDGLVLGGGADVSDGDRWPDSEPLDRRRPPAPPGQERWRRWAGLALAPAVYALRRAASRPPDRSDPARDELEHELLQRAATDRLPVLGICRGAQLLNLFAGGAAARGFVSYYDEDPQPWAVLPGPPLHVEPGTRLEASLRATACSVAGLQREAVEGLAPQLRIAARESSGTPQAFEDQRHRFWIGVQWHPEYAPQLSEQRRLFDALVANAAERREAARCASRVRWSS